MEYKEVFEDADVLLIAQSMKKERSADKRIDSNRSDLLEKMQKKTLSLVIRNSMQIHNLLEATKKLSEDVTTSHAVQEKKLILMLREKYHKKQENNQRSNETVITMAQTTNTISERLQDSETALINSMAQFGVLNLELDEAFGYAEIPAAKDNDKVKMEKWFESEKATKKGHGGQSKLPVLFELCRYDNEFKKIISLSTIFENLQITRIVPILSMFCYILTLITKFQD